jgi:hypothetical protein
VGLPDLAPARAQTSVHGSCGRATSVPDCTASRADSRAWPAHVGLRPGPQLAQLTAQLADRPLELVVLRRQFCVDVKAIMGSRWSGLSAIWRDDGLIGVHTNLLTPALGNAEALSGSPPSEEERAALDALATFRATGFGYFVEQATRPETIGYALLDSPVALAAWMRDHDTDAPYRRATLGQSHPGSHRRQHHAVLADRHRGLGGPLVLGERPRTSACGRAGSSAGLDPGRLHHVPGRDLADPAQLGREGLPQRHLLQ